MVDVPVDVLLEALPRDTRRVLAHQAKGCAPSKACACCNGSQVLGAHGFGRHGYKVEAGVVGAGVFHDGLVFFLSREMALGYSL